MFAKLLLRREEKFDLLCQSSSANAAVAILRVGACANTGTCFRLMYSLACSSVSRCWSGRLLISVTSPDVKTRSASRGIQFGSRASRN